MQFFNTVMTIQATVFNQIFDLIMKGHTTADIMKTFGKKVESTSYTPSGKHVGNALNQNQKYIGVVTAAGVMMRYGTWYSYGYEDIAKQIRTSDNNPENIGTVFKVFSQGGTADGMIEVCDAVAACKKPIVGYTDFAMSAGYGMIAPCDEIVIGKGASSSVGSIGTQYLYINEEEYLKKVGLEYELIRAKGSERKNLVNSFEPLTEEARQKLQSTVDACRKEFVGVVQRGRLGKNLSSDALTGDEFTAKEALALGLVDSIGSFESALQKVVQLSSK